MNKANIQKIIESYIQAYNNFDMAGMLEYMHPEIEFENIESGEATLRLKGIEAFKLQALAAFDYFTKREQKVTDLKIASNSAEVQIAYNAELAIDLPKGFKAGDKLELKGKSVFTFKEGKIIRLQDYS